MSVVIFYQSDGGVESCYPPEGSLAADEQQATIHGEFDLDVKYNVWLKVYEGQSVVSSPNTPSVEAQVQRPGKIVKLSCQYIFIIINYLIINRINCIVWLDVLQYNIIIVLCCYSTGRMYLRF